MIGALDWRPQQQGRGKALVSKGFLLAEDLENNQQADGSVVVPAVLRPWIGKERIIASRSPNEPEA